MNTARENSPIAGGKWAGLLFALTLVSFVLESQLTQVRHQAYRLSIHLTEHKCKQYVQTDLGFRQPYFVLYV